MNKTAIKNFAIAARITLIEAVTQRAYEYEVTENGKNDSMQAEACGKALTPTERDQRRQLIAKIQLNGFTQTMEEAAYTWFNRFIALRFMEVNGYLPSRIRVFTDESGAFKPEILSEAMRLEMTDDAGHSYIDHEYVMELLDTQENDKLYKYLLIAQCNALNYGLPEMFEEIGGWTELLFPNHLLRADSVIAHMVEDIPEEDWREQVQIIGWLYQYYNTEPKDKVFADLKKNIKISAQAIPAATQLFTPDWIVRYMVENSLGRLWTEGHGKPADADWKYYLEEAEQEDSVKVELEKLRAAYKTIQPEQMKLIDPCMGSGHILVYAFDVLMDIYTSCGWSERDAALSILQHNLYGLDIDRRAYQLAYFAVMMKARQYNRSIIKTGEVQANLANFADVMGVDTSMVPGKLQAFAEQFAYADTYGSLMEITAPEGLDEATEGYDLSFGMSRKQLDMMLRIYKYLSQKYDVVVTNPPYMGGSGMDTKLSDFVKSQFPDSKSDLFACFIEKCGQLAKQNGFYAMITMHSWMFLLSFERLRSNLMHDDVINLIHLGSNAFEQGDVGTIVQSVSFVFRNTNVKLYKGKYVNLCDYNRSEEKRAFFLNNPKCYSLGKDSFYKIPTHPYAYWASNRILKLFENSKLGEITEPRQGMTTSDNNRFTKLWYEVNYCTIFFKATNSQEAIKSKLKWFPYNKGGGYRKWYGNHEYVVNYEDDGREMKAFHEQLNKKSSGGRIKNKEYYFKKGIAWTFIALTPGFRFSPNGFIFDVAGSTLFVKDDLLEYVMAFLCSNVSKLFLRIINPTMNIQANDIKSLPFILNDNPVIKKLALENVELCENDWDSFETSWDFERHPLI